MRIQALETEKTNNPPSRIIELLEHLRLQIGDDANIEQVVTKLNQSLAKGKKISRQSLRCWYYGKRDISYSNKLRLAKALGITFEELELFLQGERDRDEFFQQLTGGKSQSSEASVISQIMRLMQQLSLPGIAEVLSKGSEMLHGYLEKMFQPVTSNSIATLVSAKPAECIDMFDGIVPNAADRLRAIMSGDRPTDVELELLASSLSVELETLRKIRKETFGNGNGVDHQGSRRDR